MKFYLHNSSYEKSKIVILGVPDKSGSRALRKNGVQKGPDNIRKISNKLDTFGKNRKVQSQTRIIDKKICDIGNVKKQSLSKKIESISNDEKIPIILGGDHSITTEVVKGLSKNNKEIVFIYFDAHPDYRCGAGNYYGSVLCEISKLKQVKMNKSTIVGMRAPESSELKNLKKSKLLVITPSEIEENISKVIKKIKKRVGKSNLYVSIDLDVIDPSSAPGVETPVPGGISSTQAIYLIQNLSKLKLIGLDLCELNPNYDIQNQTSHLASRIIAESISQIK